MKTTIPPCAASGISGIFGPAIALMKRGRYPYKFAILGCGGAVAILFLLVSLLVSLLASVNVAQRELSGLELVKPSLCFIQLVQQHRGLTSAVLAGNDALKEKAVAKEAEIAEAIQRVDATLAVVGMSPKMVDDWAAIKKSWKSLAEDWSDLARTANLQANDELVKLSLKFVYATGDASGLATDPSLDSFYLVGMSVYNMPDLIELLGQVGDAGADTYARKSMSEDQRAVFAGQSGVIRRIASELGISLERSVSYNDAIKGTLSQFQPKFLTGVNEVVVAIDGEFVTGRLAQPPQFIAGKIVKVIDLGYEELFGELLPTTQTLIDARRAKLQKQVYISLGTALVLLAISVYLFIAAYLAIMADLAGLSSTAKRIAEGDLAARVDITSEDELAVVGEGFNAMADSIDSLIGKLTLAQESLIQSEKMASIGQLAAGVAHEINNPIGYIFSNFGTLENYLAELFQMLEAYETAETNYSDPHTLSQIVALKKKMELEFLKEDIPTLMTESKEGIVRVRKIVQDLKDFSHVDATTDWQFSNLNQGIDSTLNVVNSEIKYKADVVKDYAELPLVQCMSSQINQVVMNLVVNAAHAIGSERGTITIRTGIEDGNAWFSVTDTGAGIPQEILPRIFDPFYTTKPIGKGTGLGLSLSYGIIQKHHGSIDVQTELGKGTTFRVTLPVSQANAAQTESLS